MKTTVLLAIAAYLIGSFSFSVVFSRLFGSVGTHSFNANELDFADVAHSENKMGALSILLGAVLKGWFVVWLVQARGAQWGVGELDIAVATVAIAVFAGRLWPAFFRFRGGRGVGTAFGVLMGLDAWLGLATLVTWAVVAYTSRYLSLAVVIASISAPVYYTLLFRPDINLLAMIVINALLLWRHARNIAKLLDGKERRIGDRVEADL